MSLQRSLQNGRHRLEGAKTDSCLHCGQATIVACEDGVSEFTMAEAIAAIVSSELQWFIGRK